MTITPPEIKKRVLTCFTHDSNNGSAAKKKNGKFFVSVYDQRLFGLTDHIMLGKQNTITVEADRSDSTTVNWVSDAGVWDATLSAMAPCIVLPAVAVQSFLSSWRYVLT